MGGWQELEHTADLALHIWGDDLRDLFVSAAKGMFTMVATPSTTGETIVVPVSLAALDLESLLVDWLNELLYLHETRRVVFITYEFETLTPTELNAVVQGRPVGKSLNYIKAATFHNLNVVASKAGHEVDVVFDV